MFKEYYTLIKKYIRVSQLNKLYLVITIASSILYRVGLVLVPLFASWIIKYAIEGNVHMIYMSFVYLCLSYLLYFVSVWENYRIYGRNMKYSYSRLQTMILDKLTRIDDHFTESISKGKLLNSINSDVIDIGDMMDNISEFIGSFVQILFVFIILALTNIWITLLVVLYVYIYLKTKNKYDKKVVLYLEKTNVSKDKYTSLFTQILTGLQEIKTFKMLPKLNALLGNIKKDYSRNYFLKRKFITRRDVDSRYITHFFRILIYSVVAFMIMKNMISVDVLVLVIGYYQEIISYVNRFITCGTKIREVSVAVNRVDSIINYEIMKEIPYGLCDKDDIDGTVEFQNVKFQYVDKPTLKNISFKIKPHTLTAIVGRSGSGKTSIINLLLRLYKINSGKITVDGIDIYDYSKDIYNSNVAVVNQKPFIFNMSIRKNLDFLDTNIENQIEVCKRVGIHDFISSLPQGYNTVLKENATNISGGQKQLISIARTLLSKAEILLLDEVTSSLDPDTAEHVTKLMKELKKDHTIIMITHKPEMMKKADRIIVINEGKIVGDGKHKELIDNNEYYQWLQSRKSVSKIGVFDND